MHDVKPIHAGTPHILALDGLRGLAVLGVFVFHYGGGASSSNRLARLFAHAVQFGGAGVTLFFVLSGFLITGILLDSLGQPAALRAFYLRRALRIFPLYYATLLFTLIYAAVTHNTVEVLHKLWVPALFLQNIGHLDRVLMAFPVRVWMIHYWSLAVEEHFYLAWPFLILLAGKRRLPVLCAAVCALSIVIPVVTPGHWPPILLCDFPLITSAAALALGGYLAHAHRTGVIERLRPRLPVIAAVTAVLLVPFIVYTSRFELTGGAVSPFETLSRFDLAVFLTVVVALTLHPGVLQRLFSAAWLRSIGRVSYGIYIYHWFFFRIYHLWARHLTAPHPGRLPAMTALIALVCTPPIAYASYYFLERPFLRLKNTLAPRVTDPLPGV